ncbi:MAG TPA: flavin reductase family protein [Crinalium sp.]|jgi:flavin reductase (DIM6/NTAB) family NADH-FMN oxidoreductase RutF
MDAHQSTTLDDVLGLDPDALSPSDNYRLLSHCVSPRPIAFVSTRSPDGVPNLAPFSYFMAGGANPPSVAISPVTRAGEPKDTLRNIQATGEYVINIVSYGIREPMNMASLELPYGTSEWDITGFTPAPTVKVKPARVAECLLAMECRLYQIVAHGEGSTSANYVIGEVVYFHVANQLMVDGDIDPIRVDYIARMGGNWYTRVTPQSMFELPRPRQN